MYFQVEERICCMNSRESDDAILKTKSTGDDEKRIMGPVDDDIVLL